MSVLPYEKLKEIKERQNNSLTKWNILQAQYDIRLLLEEIEKLESNEIKKDTPTPTLEEVGFALLSRVPDRFKWTIRNLIAHPLSEVLYQIGMKDTSSRIHDFSIPPHNHGKGEN